MFGKNYKKTYTLLRQNIFFFFARKKIFYFVIKIVNICLKYNWVCKKNIKEIVYLFQRVSFIWLRQRESEKTVLYQQGEGGREIGAIRTWNTLEGLPSKYYPGPMLRNFSVQTGTGVSNMINLLTWLFCFVDVQKSLNFGKLLNSRHVRHSRNCS